jgi:hypothetical protein
VEVGFAYDNIPMKYNPLVKLFLEEGALMSWIYSSRDLAQEEGGRPRGQQPLFVRLLYE